jgi:hypothetical protein
VARDRKIDIFNTTGPGGSHTQAHAGTYRTYIYICSAPTNPIEDDIFWDEQSVAAGWLTQCTPPPSVWNAVGKTIGSLCSEGEVLAQGIEQQAGKVMMALEA